MPRNRAHRTIRRAGALATLAAIASSFGLAGTAPASAAAGHVPFAATLGGTVAFTSPSTAVFHGAGPAIGMGRTRNNGVAVSAAPNPAGCVPNVNTETLTAANGDTLTLQSDDVACPIGPTTFHGTGHWVVLSGTGRFRDVTGQGSTDGDSNFGPGFSPGTFSLTLTGTLSHKKD